MLATSSGVCKADLIATLTNRQMFQQTEPTGNPVAVLLCPCSETQVLNTIVAVVSICVVYRHLPGNSAVVIDPDKAMETEQRAVDRHLLVTIGAAIPSRLTAAILL